MVRIYSKKGFRIWSILMIFCLVLSIFACTVQQASAIPVAIPVAAAVLVGSFLVASGLIFSNQESFSSAITDVWDYLSTGVKKEIEKASILYGTAVSLGKYAFNQLSQAVYNLVDPVILSSVITSGQTQSNVIYPTMKKINQWVPSIGTCYYLQEIGFTGSVWTSAYGIKAVSSLYISRYMAGVEWISITTAGGSIAQHYYSNFDESAYLSVVYSHSEGENKYYQITLKNDNGQVVIPGGLVKSTQYVPMAYPQNNYSVDPDALLGGVVNKAISDGIVDESDVASNVGSNSIDADTPIVVPPLDWGLADLINKQQQAILDLQQQIKVLTNLSTGEMTAEGELVGTGTGTGIFEGIGKWILNIPILGTILQLLINIFEAIQSLTAVSDFTIDFSPLKIGLTEVFPFCIPFDLLRMVTVYSVIPDDFVLSIDLETDYFVIDHEVDLSPFSIPIIFFRWVVTIWFSWILISRTRDMIKW